MTTTERAERMSLHEGSEGVEVRFRGHPVGKIVTARDKYGVQVFVPVDEVLECIGFVEGAGGPLLKEVGDMVSSRTYCLAQIIPARPFARAPIATFESDADFAETALASLRHLYPGDHVGHVQSDYGVVHPNDLAWLHHGNTPSDADSPWERNESGLYYRVSILNGTGDVFAVCSGPDHRSGATAYLGAIPREYMVVNGLEDYRLAADRLFDGFRTQPLSWFIEKLIGAGPRQEED